MPRYFLQVLYPPFIHVDLTSLHSGSIHSFTNYLFPIVFLHLLCSLSLQSIISRQVAFTGKSRLLGPVRQSPARLTFTASFKFTPSKFTPIHHKVHTLTSQASHTFHYVHSQVHPKRSPQAFTTSSTRFPTVHHKLHNHKLHYLHVHYITTSLHSSRLKLYELTKPPFPVQLRITKRSNTS